METFVTVGMKGTNYVVLVCGHPALKGVELTEREAHIVRNFLCCYLGLPTAAEIANAWEDIQKKS